MIPTYPQSHAEWKSFTRRLSDDPAEPQPQIVGTDRVRITFMVLFRSFIGFSGLQHRKS